MARGGPHRPVSRAVPDWVRDMVVDHASSGIRKRLWLWRKPLTGNGEGFWREPTDW